MEDDFARAVDIGDDGRLSHGAGFEDDVGEAFAVAGEDKGVGGRKPGADVGLLTDGLDGRALFDGRNGVGAQGVERRFLTANQKKACGRMSGVKRGECPDEFVDAFVADKTADENEGEEARLANLRSFGLNIRTAGAEAVEVDAPHIAVAENPQRLAGDAIGDEVVLDALSFRDYVGGTGACETVGEYKYLLFQACGSRKDKAGEGVEPDRHTTYPGGDHRQQAGFRCDRVDHHRLLATEYTDQTP